MEGEDPANGGQGMEMPFGSPAQDGAPPSIFGSPQPQPMAQ